MYRFFKIFFFLFSACFFAQDGIKFENETFQNILNKMKVQCIIGKFSENIDLCFSRQHMFIPLSNYGDFYEGDFRNGKIHGEGDYKGANGARYIGGFVNHQREGKGKEIHKNGTIFEGDYVNGLPHGNGRATLPDGRTITGKWYKGEYQR